MANSLPYSGNLWRQKTLANLANCCKICQSLTLQSLLQHTGSISNNAHHCNILQVITKSELVFRSTVSPWNLLVHPRFCLCRSQMDSLSKKVPYPRDNFLLSPCQFTASSHGNSKFMEFVCLSGTDSISQESPKFYLLTHYFTYSPKFFRQFIVLYICQSFPPPKFSTIRYIFIHGMTFQCWVVYWYYYCS